MIDSDALTKQRVHSRVTKGKDDVTFQKAAMHLIIINRCLSFPYFDLSLVYVLGSVLFGYDNNYHSLFFTDVHMHNTRGRHNLLVLKYGLQRFPIVIKF